MAELTFNPDADTETNTVDGWTFSNATESWALARNRATATTSNDSGNDIFLGYIRTNTSEIRGLTRGFYLFDISSIPSGSTIDAVDFQAYVDQVDNASSNGSPSVVIVEGAPASDTAVATGDHDIDGFGTTRFASDTAFSAYSLNAYNSHTLNASGISFVQSALDGDGIVRLSSFTDLEFDDTEPDYDNVTTRVIGQSAETANPPKLVVTYTEGGADPFIPKVMMF